MSNNAEVKYSGKLETFSFLKKSESSPDLNHFIFKINVEKKPIRHRGTLNLNDVVSNRFLVDEEIHHSISELLYV